MGTTGFRLPQFRRFGSRLLILIVGIVAVAQVANYALVRSANRRNAVDRIHGDLNQGALLFSRRIGARLDELAGRAALMSDDYSIRQLLLKEQPDSATIRSALNSYKGRMGVPFMALFTPEGSRIGDTGGALPDAALGPFQDLVRVASAAEDPMAKGFARLPPGGPGGNLYALLVMPIYAPRPEIVAWIGLALPIDRAFASELRADTRLEVTFYYGLSGEMQPVESTLPEANARSMAPSLLDTGIRDVQVGGESYVTAYRPLLPLLTPGRAAIALQRSLEAELAPSRALERFLLVLLLLSLCAASLIAPVFARNLSRPLRALRDHTEVIARGEYSRHLDLDRRDEIGQLATAFNRMSDGLAERDRVRDLLDKNVSPEVAAQLMRDGGALGGEEREITVLFVDLRSFTRLSQAMPPRDVLLLLNRFFDRMSGIVEIYHGVVDKYIGDAIMALFGAPVAHPTHADCAILAALEMKSALARLNAELTTEGRANLSFGIGINTARIIAGNIGSSRRLNYSVVGDGVNVAARLQDLTRMSQFRADILVNSTTLKAAKGRYRVRAL
ncbi:MAG TPA: adenylate/guanylate cyclase domain-containing protein, partial [Opitutaceae bacterium]|nr:adenylate/guanylate cyclase domain-containing protein [Opitutaceae bacterium]